MPNVSEKPILFSTPMIRAILDGSKTQTRRVVKPTQSKPKVAPLRMEPWLIDDEQETDDNGLPCWAGFHPDYPGEAKWFSCPYGKAGDLLWVRETWARHPDEPGIIWRATDPGWDDNDYGIKWRPSIHMPRWASRIMLEVTGVRVERVQDISATDAYAEIGRPTHATGRDDFRALWDEINDKRGYGWDANPWVWCISFREVTS